jgi:hypothetical protein
MEVVEETISYIDDLHRLVTRVETKIDVFIFAISRN